MKRLTLWRRSVQHRRSHRCVKLYKHTVKLVSALFLPLLLAIFTVIVAFEQRKENQQQRFEDRELARTHREQELNISILAREADKLAARLQRENDREIAESQGNMSRQLEDYRYEQERIKYLDSLLANYLDDIGQLLKENNGSLTSSFLAAALGRAKTMHILRMGIGSIRSSQIIHFLYDAGQLTVNQNPLDLSNAPLDGIYLTGSSMNSLSLVRTRLINASFIGLDVSNGNFVGAYLKNANFSGANCTNVDFQQANLFQSDFSSAILTNAKFDHNDLAYSTLANTSLINVKFHSANLSYTTLASSDCTNATFEQTILIKSDFSYATLTQTQFRQVNLLGATFSFAKSEDFHGWGCLFNSSQLERSNFTQTDLYSLTFINCNITKSIFYQSQVKFISILYSDATNIDFTSATLFKGQFNVSIFKYASFVNADIRGTVFNYVDLTNANLSGAQCSNNVCLWNESVFLENATLPNGSLGRFKNLIEKSPVQCNLSVEEHGWHIIGKHTIVTKPNWNGSDQCVFTLSPDSTDGKMNLFVNLSRFTDFIDTGRSFAHIKIQQGKQVITNIRSDQSSHGGWTWSHHQTNPNFKCVTAGLHPNTRSLTIDVRFRASVFGREELYFYDVVSIMGLWLDHLEDANYQILEHAC
ncbi:unnamed protein product [Rotaria sp. Silwood2]|nr:unnamed protein product [Rotaria sp. Silwood2]CAF3862622.1 unnamed protein product [Rotaria sp. Silwood2]